MTMSNQRLHLFPLGLLLTTSFAIGLIVIYSCYFDNDALFQVLIPIKRGTLSLKNIRPYASLLPSILLVINPYLDPLIGYIILGICTGVGTAFLVYWITVSQTKNRIVGILCMFMILILNGSQILIRTLDDNLFPLPLVLLSFYLLFVETQQPAENQRIKRIFASGLLLSIAIAFHLHTVILIPLFIFCNFTDYRMQFKRRVKNSLIAFLGIISFFMPLVFLIMVARGTISIENLITPTAYSSYFNQPKWYLFAKKRTVTELIYWFFQWFAGMITYNSPFLLIRSPEYYSFVYQGILFFVSSIIWFGFIVGVPLFFLLKSFQEQKKKNLFVIWGYLVFLLTGSFAFVFTPQDPERWALAIPFLVINFGIGLNTISKTQYFRNRFLQKFYISGSLKGFTRLKRWSSNKKLIGLLLVCLALIKYSAGFAYAIMSPTRNDWPYPNKSIIDDIIQSVPENAPLILGPADDWNIVSYYRFGWTLYIRWDGQLQDAILWDNGRLSDLNKLKVSSISSMMKTYLDRGIVVFAHEEAISFLQAQGFDTEYNLTVYKEFRHWSPLDLIKGERNPNRIYTMTHQSEGYQIPLSKSSE